MAAIPKMNKTGMAKRSNVGRMPSTIALWIGESPKAIIFISQNARIPEDNPNMLRVITVGLCQTQINHTKAQMPR